MRHDRDWQPTVYILASRRHGTLYVGVTSDLARRVHEHCEGLIAGFTRDYGVRRLVHLETFASMDEAILRERRLKKWRRMWKIVLIEERNPYWEDLGVTMLGFPPLPDAGRGSPLARG